MTTRKLERSEWQQYFDEIAKRIPVAGGLGGGSSNAAAVIDVSPLFKYDVTGADALQLVNKIMMLTVEVDRVNEVEASLQHLIAPLGQTDWIGRWNDDDLS